MQNDKGYTWRVIKSAKRYNKSRPHKLEKGDVMKLGRYIFEVKEISSNKGHVKAKDQRFVFVTNI
jgi:predicted component of type VI protein secretion system